MECSDRDDAAWAEARRKADVISRTLADAPANVRLSLNEAARVLRVSRATIGRWRINFEAERRVTTLLPRRPGRPPGASQVDPRVDEVIDRQLRTHYLLPERPSIRSLLERIHTRCDELGLSKPSWRAIKLRIQRLDARTTIARREGAAAARAIFTPAVDEYRSAGPLDVVQIDHTTVDLIVIDEVTRQPIGRPILTLAIDVHTRLITGFCLALDYASTLRAGVCVAQSVFEQEAWLAERGIDLPWPAAGLPRAVHVDNAGEFHSKALRGRLKISASR